MKPEKAKWIWLNKEPKKDEYAVFISNFTIENGKTLLHISADSNYQVWINGELSAFGQYPDYPHYKVYDEVDITNFVQNGDNKIAVIVWYYGADSQTYTLGQAGVIFEIVNNGKVVQYSDENTLSRLALDHVSHVEKLMTGPIGFSFIIDPNAYDGYLEKDYVPRGFGLSSVVESAKDLMKRPIKRLILTDFVEAHKIKSEYEIFDLGAETVGFIKIKYRAPKGKKFSIYFGEHIADGRVRDIIGDRNYSVEFVGTGDEVEVCNYFRRLGCRYLEVRDSDCDIVNIGIVPVCYPVQEVSVRLPDATLQKIYDISVQTLKLCMHEHYEDCPWREQALYTMDSRNQMLCGYYAFKEYSFARASLELMAQAQKPDKLLPLCFPAGQDTPIPFFSLIYIKQMREYAEYSGDVSLIKTYIRLLREIVGVFVDRLDEDGKLYDFAGYWNFYEWSDGLDGIINEQFFRNTENCRLELPLICFMLIAIDDLNVCEAIIGENPSFTDVKACVIQSANETFWAEEKGAYRTFFGQEHYSKLVNALAILSGIAKGKESIVANTILSGHLIDTTLSMKAFEYDALLSVSDRYSSYILEEIRRNYSFMIENGATSFWETIKGEQDFSGAGSLCHGWSAIPIYYFNLFSLATGGNNA